MIDGQTVAKATDTSGTTGYVWIRHGVAAELITENPNLIETFLHKYFAPR